MALTQQPSPVDAFALNAIAVNGVSPYEYKYLSGSVDMTLSTALVGTLGNVGVGTLGVSFTTAVDGVLWNMGAGSFDVQLATGLNLIAGRVGQGDIPVTWTNALAPQVWRRGEGVMATDMTLTFDLIAGRTGEGQIPITLTTTAEGSIKGHVDIAGDILIEYITQMDGRAAYAHRPDYDLDIYLDVSGSANLIHQPTGTIGMEMVLDGRIIKARRVYGEGHIGMETGFNAQMFTRTLRYGQGDIGMTMELEQSATGWPGVPSQFNAAPRWRVLQVNRDDRDMRVVARREVN